jgi:hypothetical protein
MKNNRHIFIPPEYFQSTTAPGTKPLVAAGDAIANQGDHSTDFPHGERCFTRAALKIPCIDRGAPIIPPLERAMVDDNAGPFCLS